MKRTAIILCAALLALPLMAQKATPEEKGARDFSSWHPKAGDFTIGFGINPLTEWLSSNTLGNELENLGGESLVNNLVSVMGAYHISSTLALRANLGFGYYVNTDGDYVRDDFEHFSNPLSEAKVVDSRKETDQELSAALGLEYRVGKRSRVQGVFGGGLVYSYRSYNVNYSYGNEITDINHTPTTANNNWYYGISYMPEGARQVRQRSAYGNHYAGIYGTAGVEIFVAPRIALGANVNVMCGYRGDRQSYVDYEGWNTVTSQKEIYTNLIKPASRGFNFSTGHIGANLYIAFSFGK